MEEDVKEMQKKIEAILEAVKLMNCDDEEPDFDRLNQFDQEPRLAEAGA